MNSFIHSGIAYLSSKQKFMSSDNMNGTNIMKKDAKGYYCGRCRQRFPTNTTASELPCPSCQRVSSYTIEKFCNLKENSRVAHVVEKFHKWVSGNRQERSDGDKLISLNCDPSPLIPSQRSMMRPRKRALLIGVTYTKRKYKLEGPVNDVKNMRKFLIGLGFQQQNILVLTEEEKLPEFIPTKKNIQRSLNWLVEDCQAGDSLVFYFSGHGIRQPDFNNDEIDGYDETICPVDFMQEGMILDNDINSTIVWPLPKNVTLHAIVDACHSGTILDLVHVYDFKKEKWQDNKPPNGSKKDTKGGLAISISACEDDQMAADTSAFVGKGMNGTLTYILTEIVRKHPGPTYYDLIDMIYETIDTLNQSRCFPTRMIRAMLHNKFLQKPQLSASEEFDVREKHFIL